ncbi:hypothetical protein TrCOL_g10795 [Triparma columacea]|uniref:Uncharacterized protein n=1 Tax=Triparma columacea TaxID=722753 RepID=A0A9W7L7D4_9STRA|nr:hypothetical protein TrCOL_g10795 [Triparma columacea]
MRLLKATEDTIFIFVEPRKVNNGASKLGMLVNGVKRTLSGVEKKKNSSLIGGALRSGTLPISKRVKGMVSEVKSADWTESSHLPCNDPYCRNRS